MRKITYPTGKTEIQDFNARYIAALQKVKTDEIDDHLLKARHHKGKPLTFNQLAVLPFEELLVVAKILQDYAATCDVPTTTVMKNGKSKTVNENKFLDLFSYEDNDDFIAKFFISEHQLNLKTCHYCGIDYINAFKDFGDYLGPVDFLNRADVVDLQFIHRLGITTAKEIIAHRTYRKIRHIDEIKLNKDVKSAILSFDFNNTHSHFTLDHVLPKGKYKFFSLSLYNLVPSCYSCNSKFKHLREFVIDKDILKVSPTSNLYRLSEDFAFHIRYSGLLKNITKTTDFAIQLVPAANFKQLDNYIKIFKLNGRYTFHKSEILELIKFKVQNPKSEILKKARMLKISPSDVEKLIYGKELFVNDSPSPMHKFKRDIAKSIKIIT